MQDDNETKINIYSYWRMAEGQRILKTNYYAKETGANLWNDEVNMHNLNNNIN